MLLLGRKSAPQKLAAFLLELSERLIDPSCDANDAVPLDRFELAFSRRHIADVLGLTIETVSRQFTRMTGQNLIALPSRREVTILDRRGLERQAA